jgi:hypothetical protein
MVSKVSLNDREMKPFFTIFELFVYHDYQFSFNLIYDLQQLFSMNPKSNILIVWFKKFLFYHWTINL